MSDEAGRTKRAERLPAARGRPGVRPEDVRSAKEEREGRDRALSSVEPSPLIPRRSPGECHLYLAEGCHLYIAPTHNCRSTAVMESRNSGGGPSVKGAAVVVGWPYGYFEGQGSVTGAAARARCFRVDYEIHIGGKPLGRNAVGLPPVTRPTIEAATKITAVDGRQIPDPGQHVLMNERGAEVLRLAKDFGKWYGLNP